MLNQETIIKLAVQHGFKVGRDAGGEYVAPKYEDAVGSLVALVQAAYALGQETKQAEPVAREPDFYVVTGGYNHMHEWCDSQQWIADKDDVKRLGSQFSYVGGYYAAQPPAVPDDYALVPVVASDRMRAAGRIGIQRGIKFEAELTPSECGLVWAYMVGAAAQKGGEA